uniref:Uncharacterized protein n=1 Tax=Timema poppense TaxID=170557 RepID=A0A7R9CVJ7_TIMPO|nr:unnamed protein product [Timema poppensis]
MTPVTIYLPIGVHMSYVEFGRLRTNVLSQGTASYYPFGLYALSTNYANGLGIGKVELEEDPGSHGAGTSVSECPYPPCWTSSGRWAPACLPAVSRYHRTPGTSQAVVSYLRPAMTLANPSDQGLKLAKGAQQNPCKVERLFLTCLWARAYERKLSGATKNLATRFGGHWATLAMDLTANDEELGHRVLLPVRVIRVITYRDNGLGIGKVEFRGSEPVFAWKPSGNPIQKKLHPVHLTDIRTSFFPSTAV